MYTTDIDDKGLIDPILTAYMIIVPIYAMEAMDCNGDGTTDLVPGGNQFYNRIRLGRDDANHGQVFLNDGKGHFRYEPPDRSGLTLRGEIRSMEVTGDLLIVGPRRVYSNKG